MLNYLWAGMILVGIIYASFTGRIPDITNAAIDSSKEAVSLCITMIGVLSMWMGLMKIAECGGMIASASRRLRPLIRFLFPNLPAGHSSEEYIITNFIANLLGLGWAATPAGLKAMEELEKRGLADVLTSVKRPFLGICLGMQLMCSFSEEGNTGMLSIVDADVRRFDPSICPKIPHIGWNTAYDLKGPLFEGIKDGSYFFFDHSYYVPLLGRATSAVTSYYGFSYTSALERDNFFGVQFHPEKSGKAGSILLENFLNMEI